MDWTSITMICQWKILAIGVEKKIYNIPYEKYLYQSIGAIYVPYMSPIISIGEL